MTIGFFLEHFQNDAYITDLIRKDISTTRQYYHYPAFSWSKREVNQEGAAFRNFWADTNAALLRYHFERKYGVNVTSKKQMSIVTTALKILFFEICKEESFCERKPD